MSGVATAGMHEVPGRGRLMARSNVGAALTAIGESESGLKPLLGFLPHGILEPNSVAAVMAGVFATPSTGLVGLGVLRERAL